MNLKLVLCVLNGLNVVAIVMAVSNSDDQWIPVAKSSSTPRQNRMLLQPTSAPPATEREAKILNEPFKEVIENDLVYYARPHYDNSSKWPAVTSSVKVNPFDTIKPIPAFSYADVVPHKSPEPHRKQMVESKKEPPPVTVKKVMKLPDLMPPQLMNRLFTVRASVISVVHRIQGFIDMIWSFFAHGPTETMARHLADTEDDDDVGEGRKRKIRIRKQYKKFMLPLLIAYKLKFFTLVPVIISGLILLAGSTGMAGFFFALFAAVISLKHSKP